MKKQLTALALAMASLAPVLANAGVVENVDMTFQSGATFVGSVTFADDFSAATNVSGTLSGGSYGSEAIDWVWAPSANFSSGTDNYSNFLMSGSPQGWANFIQIAVNYSDPAQLVFTSGKSYDGTDNYIDYSDRMVSGSISSAVPETSSALMTAFGAAALFMFTRRKNRRA